MAKDALAAQRCPSYFCQTVVPNDGCCKMAELEAEDRGKRKKVCGEERLNSPAHRQTLAQSLDDDCALL